MYVCNVRESSVAASLRKLVRVGGEDPVVRNKVGFGFDDSVNLTSTVVATDDRAGIKAVPKLQMKPLERVLLMYSQPRPVNASRL